MKLRAAVCVLCASGLMLTFLSTPPRVGAQGAGWGTAELIEIGLGNVNVYQIAVDPNGNAVAVWDETVGAYAHIWANRYVAGSGWASPVLLETNDTASASNPQVAVDRNGNAMAVWEQEDGVRESIFANRYVVGIGWGAPELVETNDTEYAILPRVGVDSGGNAVAVWEQYAPSSNINLWANRYVVGSGWGTAKLVETNTTVDAWGVRLAADSSGNAIAIWLQQDGLADHVWANRYVVGSGWGTAQLIETNYTANIELPQLAIYPNGNAVVVWSQYDGPLRDVWAVRYTAGTGWGTPGLIENDDTADTRYPQVAVSSNGDAMTVWGHDDGADWSVWSSRYVGTGWGTPEMVDNGTAYCNGQKVALDPLGNAVVAWYQLTNPMHGDIYANEYVVGLGWRTAQLIETNSADTAYYPEVAVDTDGNAFAIWRQQSGTPYHLWANRYEPPDLLPPVAEAGPNQTVLAGDLVTFDGSGSTDDRGIISYEWTFNDGGLRTLWGVTSTYSFHDTGFYAVTLTVRDAAAHNDTDVLYVTVNPIPDSERPLANAGPDQSVTAGTVVSFDGSASTDNVGVVNFTWTFIDNGARTMYGAKPSYRFGNVGTFVVTLTVKDARSNSDSDELVVTVTPPPDTQNPVADAGPDRSILTGATVVFDGSGSTDNVGVVNYTWNFTYDGSSRTLYGQLAVFRFDIVGNYSINLTVRDAAGNSDYDLATVLASAPGDGTADGEVISPLTITAIALLVILVAAFIALFPFSRKKKDESPPEERIEEEEPRREE